MFCAQKQSITVCKYRIEISFTLSCAWMAKNTLFKLTRLFFPEESTLAPSFRCLVKHWSTLLTAGKIIVFADKHKICYITLLVTSQCNANMSDTTIRCDMNDIVWSITCSHHVVPKVGVSMFLKNINTFIQQGCIKLIECDRKMTILNECCHSALH